MIKFDIIPKERVGPFLFGSKIKEYSILPIIRVDEEYDEETGWISYKLKDRDIRIYVENEKIIAVAIYDECFFQGKNLIGIDINKLNKIINVEPNNYDKMELDTGSKEVFDYDTLGIQVYVVEGMIDSITCSD